MLGVGAHERLEHEFLWGRHNVACSSGTAALHLALECLQLPQGSRVAVPNYTMVACARAVVLAGLTPVFIGTDSRLLMDLDALDSADFDAVMAVHIYGRQQNMDALHAVAAKRNAPVVEDMAELHGFKPHRDTAAACWSFYKNKIVAGEEGGLVEFREHERAKLAKQLRCLGFTAEHDFMHVPRGHNYRLADSLAERVLASLKEFSFNAANRRAVEQRYEEQCPKQWRMPHRDSPWVYDIRVRGMCLATQRKAVASVVGARHGFKNMHRQAEFRKCELVGPTFADSEVMYLPLNPELQDPFTPLKRLWNLA